MKQPTRLGICNPSLDEKPVADENGTIPDPCFSGNDLYIEDDDILVLKQGSQTNFTATIHSLNVDENNVEVTFFGVTSQNLIKQTNTQTVSLTPSDTSATFSVKWTVNFDDIIVAVDSSDIVDENDETNNQARVSAVKVKAYLNISTGMPLVDAEIEDYLKKYVDSVSEANAEVTIAVGNPNTNSLVKQYNSYTMFNLLWGYGYGVRYNGATGEQPYNAIIGSFVYPNDQKTRIFVYGNEIEGTVAGVKRLVDEKDKFLTKLRENKETYIGKYDFDAYSIWDVMHQSGNVNIYNKNIANFAGVVEALLNDRTYEESIKYVKESGSNTQLRVKHIASTLSVNTQNAVSTTPVVLAWGLWSDLFSSEDFGQELAAKGRDVWLIETTGGPDIECTDCPAYTYDDVVDYYFPALTAGVLKYSNKNSIDFVGYSLNARIGIDSATEYEEGKNNVGYYFSGGDWQSMDLPADSINHFVGIGLPGALEGDYLTKDILADDVDDAVSLLGAFGDDHPNSREFYLAVLPSCLIHFEGFPLRQAACTKKLWTEKFQDSPRLSRLLFSAFNEWASSEEDPQPGNGYSPAKFSLIYGYDTQIPSSSGHDDVVPIKDVEDICTQISSADKALIKINEVHGRLGDNSIVRDITYRRLNDLALTNDEVKNNYVGDCDE